MLLLCCNALAWTLIDHHDCSLRLCETTCMMMLTGEFGGEKKKSDQSPEI